ncbi:hypothetical protein LSO07_16585 [Janthinobacterium sp. PLB04]|uniref:Uncharacterized protein n=1 Tax=Janthinobacterium lividum TaxID=29581 RepID=A0AAJ4T3E4_9BURK|nr:MULTISPECIES: hypothetical protein [Janthinobacterium]KAB0325265.1 hypothetical protein F3B38_16480 [Janthinobacterium lividum]QSX94353.1 hypothetical protein J3P46_16570 [Janthinobacterium lividum]UGQ34135.1 hypothetical protein LSO07_16585 [Janthinobacterium sp. PLB04]
MCAKKFVPYANESDVLDIGNLTIENRIDRISISGDIDLTLDKPGLALAKQLQKLLGDVVAQLEKQDLPDQLPPPEVTSVANPFE